MDKSDEINKQKQYLDTLEKAQQISDQMDQSRKARLKTIKKKQEPHTQRIKSTIQTEDKAKKDEGATAAVNHGAVYLMS